jgi:uncharacterized protein YdhG (YjbR/CyaY superfamily)
MAEQGASRGGIDDVTARYRELARAEVPDAEDGESYGMPALRYRGRPLISVIAIKAGYAVYPFSPEVVEAALPSLAGFASTKGGVKFTAERPVPDDVFLGMVRGRRDEIDAALGGTSA